MKKRILALVLCACALCGVVGSASGSVSQDDNTLISKSYLEGTYRQELQEEISQRVAIAGESSYNSAVQTLDTLGQSYLDKLAPDDGEDSSEWLSAGAYVDQGGEKDDVIILAAGAGLILTEGSAQVSGILVDLTDGKEVSSGQLTKNHRYVAEQESVITVTSAVAYWSVEGKWQTTSDGVTERPVVFEDVSADSWYYESVYFVVDQGLFVGTSETKFSPLATMNRGMLATVLHRLAGTPAVAYSPVFSDVPDGLWYTNGVVWAAANRVVNGMGDGTYRPTGDLSRQQIAVMLYNYANWVGIDTSDRADLSAYPDGASVASWAKDAMSWAVSAGIIQGDTNSRLTPAANANRAQVATMLQRFSGLLP